jgi:hypothetical protein
MFIPQNSNQPCASLGVTRSRAFPTPEKWFLPGGSGYGVNGSPEHSDLLIPDCKNSFREALPSSCKSLLLCHPAPLRTITIRSFGYRSAISSRNSGFTWGRIKLYHVNAKYCRLLSRRSYAPDAVPKPDGLRWQPEYRLVELLKKRLKKNAFVCYRHVRMVPDCICPFLFCLGMTDIVVSCCRYPSGRTPYGQGYLLVSACR